VHNYINTPGTTFSPDFNWTCSTSTTQSPPKPIKCYDFQKNVHNLLSIPRNGYNYVTLVPSQLQYCSILLMKAPKFNDITTIECIQRTATKTCLIHHNLGYSNTMYMQYM